MQAVLISAMVALGFLLSISGESVPGQVLNGEESINRSPERSLVYTAYTKAVYIRSTMGWRTNARHLDYSLLNFIFDYIDS